MQVREFDFQSVSGKPLRATAYLPEGEIRGIVQIVHGMSEHIGRYEMPGKALAEAGFIAVGHSHLGHGETADVLGHFGDEGGWDALLGDIHLLRQTMQKEYPHAPYFVLGHSMGSFLTRCYIQREGAGLAGAVISGTGYYNKPTVWAGLALARCHMALGKGREPAKLIDKMAFSGHNRQFSPGRTGHEWLSRDEGRVDSYMEDPLCGFMFTAKGYHDLFTGLHRLTKKQGLETMPHSMPVYFFSGTEDPVGQNGKGVIRVVGDFLAAGMEKVAVRLYPGGRHEMFNEINAQEVIDELIGWLMVNGAE